MPGCECWPQPPKPQSGGTSRNSEKALAFQAFRIAPDDSSHFACPLADGARFTMVPEAEFAALIRHATPMEPNAEDLTALCRAQLKMYSSVQR